MYGSRLLRNALFLTVFTVPLAAQAAFRITDIDLGVPGVPENRRAPRPSHRVFVGDRARIEMWLQHDGNIQSWSTSWSTTAPVTGPEQRPAGVGLLTAVPSPYTHPFVVGYATFRSRGRYKLDVSVHLAPDPNQNPLMPLERLETGNASASFDIEVVELQAVIAPVSVACLAPAVQWASPAVNGQICLNQPATLRVNPTFHGCAPNTVDIYVEAKGGAAWALLGSRTAAPWSVTHTFADAGPERLKVVARDKNGAKAEAVITATVSQCLDASKFKH